MGKRSRKKSGTTTTKGGKSTTTKLRAVINAQPKLRAGPRTEFRIYPSIGVSRIGDSEDGYIIGPESAGISLPGPYRGANDKGILPQAARFRIYKIVVDANENETVIEEVVASSNVQIKWKVTLANRKAAGNQIFNGSDGGTLGRSNNPSLRNPGLDRNKLVILSSGTVSGISSKGPTIAGKIEFAKSGATGPSVENIILARIETDSAGRLVVVGGPGKSGSPLNSPVQSFSDNGGWYDSVSDGPVDATLTIGGQQYGVVPAWALVTVPRYSPETYGIVTWYDQAVSMARTNLDGTFNAPKTTSFTKDIFPLLKRADGLSAVHSGTHSSRAPSLSNPSRISGFKNRAERAIIADRLTPLGTAAPEAQLLPVDTMPRLYSGANPEPSGPIWTFLALTKYQMNHIQNWVNGNYQDDWSGSEPQPQPFDSIPLANRPWALCRAALEACVGGAFFPGIEGTYDMARLDTYHSEPNLRQEFRVRPTHSPGFLTEKMALPWQADFSDCSDYWWPSQRPVTVHTEAGTIERWARGVEVTNTQARHLNMVSSWMKLGFIVRDPSTRKFVEMERTFQDLIS